MQKTIIMVCFLFMLMVFSSTAVEGLCPNGFTRYNVSCYYIGYDRNLSFIDAEHYCEQHHNSHLIHVDSAEENTFIIDVLRKTSAWFCWIGLTDMDVENVWAWYGTNEKPGYTYWAQHEPGGGEPEDCAVYTARHSDYRWDDFPCSRHFHPLCELEVNDEGVIIG